MNRHLIYRRRLMKCSQAFDDEEIPRIVYFREFDRFESSRFRRVTVGILCAQRRFHRGYSLGVFDRQGAVFPSHWCLLTFGLGVSTL